MSPFMRRERQENLDTADQLSNEIPVQQEEIHEQPDSNLVPIGTAEYFLDAPEVQRMVALSQNYGGVIALMKGTTVETINRKLEEAPIDRRLKRALIHAGVGKEAGLAAQALAQLLAEPGRYQKGNVQARYQAGAHAMSSYRGQLPILNEEAVYQDIYRAAANHEPRLIAYWDNSDGLTERLERDLDGLPNARYELAKLVASYAKTAESPSDPINTRRVGWAVKLLSSPAANGKSLLSDITREVAQGNYRSTQAYELLADEDARKPAVQKFINLMGHASSTEANEEVLRRLAEAHAMWPKEMAILLDDSQAETVQAMKAARERARTELGTELGLMHDGLTSDERFGAAMKRMIDSIRNLPRFAAHDGVPQFARKQVSGIGKPLVARTVSPQPIKFAPTPEVIKEVNNTVLYIDGAGEKHPKDSPKYLKLTADFLDKYRNAKSLPEDLEAALKYLEALDMRKLGAKHGVKRIAAGDWGVQNDEGVVLARPLYEFKPQAAAAFPIRTEVMRDHRILFTTVDNDTVGIVGIVARRDLVRFLKDSGIKTGGQ